jgi:hypothetical protein
MQSKRWVSWIAVAGILLHATATARHNVMLFDSLAKAGVLCTAALAESEDAQKLPAKVPANKTCPICMGLVSAHALPPSEAPTLRVPQTPVALAFVPQDRQSEPQSDFRQPSNRGPPALA